MSSRGELSGSVAAPVALAAAAGASGADAPALERLCSWLVEQVVQAQRAGLGRPLVVGLVGLPGSGKSTLATALCQAVGAGQALSVSLDDFYLEAAERAARGFRHRGPPGTHDLGLLSEFLAQLKSSAEVIAVPQFDRDRELRWPARRLPVDPQAPLRLCLIEGWFVGAAAPGYEPLAAALDRLIFLDMAEEDAKSSRLAREERLRAAGRPVMSAAAVARFWAEALAPHFAPWVFPLRARADAVLAVDAAHQPTRLWLRGDPSP